MRLAILSTMGGAAWGGSEELWAATAREAIAQGAQVDVHLWRHRQPRPQALALRQSGAGLHQYPPPDGGFQIWKQRFVVRHPSLVRRFAPLLLSFDKLLRARPDVVLLSLSDTYVLGLHREFHFLVDELISRAIPYVVVVHLSVDHWHPDASAAQVTRRAFGHAHRVGFVSEHNLRLVERQLELPIPNGLVVRNPVNMADRSLVAWPADPIASFAMPARFQSSHKGHDILVDVLSQNEWRTRPWALRLYGSGPDEMSIRERVCARDLSDRVQFCGHVDDVRSIWAGNQLLVMPSRMEGTPLAMIEAMLCGRAAVCTSVGGIPEWIGDGVEGFLAAEATVTSMADAMERAWTRRDQWQSMGMRARDRALQQVDPNPAGTILSLLLDAAGAGSHR